jgi:hypothetical protein
MRTTILGGAVFLFACKSPAPAETPQNIAVKQAPEESYQKSIDDSAGVNLHTYTGWGTVTYWNAYVANTQMHGVGTFFDPRLDDPKKFPVAAKAKTGHTRPRVDHVTENLAALHFYQLAIPPPKPPDDSYDKRLAAQGQALFNGKAT